MPNRRERPLWLETTPPCRTVAHEDIHRDVLDVPPTFNAPVDGRMPPERRRVQTCANSAPKKKIIDEQYTRMSRSAPN